MFGHESHLRHPEVDSGEADGPLLGKREALAQFFRLQSRGYFPCMVEEEHGNYRVFIGDSRE